MKYRKKPVVIEAMQFTHDNKYKVYDWAQSINENADLTFLNGEAVILIPTLDGERIDCVEKVCSIGDYIIKNVQGVLYPCKPDIFEQTYETVDEESEISRLLKETCPICGREPFRNRNI